MAAVVTRESFRNMIIERGDKVNGKQYRDYKQYNDILYCSMCSPNTNAKNEAASRVCIIYEEFDAKMVKW